MDSAMGLGNSNPNLVGFFRIAWMHLIRSTFPNAEYFGNDNINAK